VVANLLENSVCSMRKSLLNVQVRAGRAVMIFGFALWAKLAQLIEGQCLLNKSLWSTSSQNSIRPA
jgi:hypothetical protein